MRAQILRQTTQYRQQTRSSQIPQDITAYSTLDSHIASHSSTSTKQGKLCDNLTATQQKSPSAVHRNKHMRQKQNSPKPSDNDNVPTSLNSMSSLRIDTDPEEEGIDEPLPIDISPLIAPGHEEEPNEAPQLTTQTTSVANL
jgi:hypothetical protein